MVLCVSVAPFVHSGKSRCTFIHDKQRSSVDCMMMWFRKYCFEYFWSWFLNNFLKIWLNACESQIETAKCSRIGPCTDAPKRHCYRIWPRLSLMEAAAMIFSRQSSLFIFNADLFSTGAGWVWETWLAHRLIFQYQMCIQVWLTRKTKTILKEHAKKKKNRTEHSLFSKKKKKERGTLLFVKRSRDKLLFVFGLMFAYFSLLFYLLSNS